MGDNNALRLTSNIVFFVLSVAIFILRILDNDPLNMVVEFESYALVASILYYIIMTFMDSLKGKLGDTFDKVIDFFKEKMFKYIWAFEMCAGLGYWLGVCLGWMNMSKEPFLSVLLMYLFHAVIQVLLVVDLVFFKHKLDSSFLTDFIVISLSYLAYGLFIIIKRFCFNRGGPYPFVGAQFKFVFAVGIVYYMLLLVMYFIHQLVLMIKNGISIGKDAINKLANETLV